MRCDYRRSYTTCIINLGKPTLETKTLLIAKRFLNAHQTCIQNADSILGLGYQNQPSFPCDHAARSECSPCRDLLPTNYDVFCE